MWPAGQSLVDPRELEVVVLSEGVQLAMGNKSPRAKRYSLACEQRSNGQNCNRKEETYKKRDGTDGENMQHNTEGEQIQNEEENVDNSDHPTADDVPRVANDDDKEMVVDSTDEREDSMNITKLTLKIDKEDERITKGEPTAPTEFTVMLKCVPENSQKVATLLFDEKCPDTIIDLKQGVEVKFGIPVSCQNVYLDNIQLEDEHSLTFYRLRDGETLYVQYSSTADYEDVLDIVASLCSMITYIEGIQPTLSHGRASEVLQASLAGHIFAHKVESLAVQYFYPCNTERANANRLLFVQHGGLDYMHKVHELLLLQPWQRTPIEMQYLEHAILRVLWNITASFLIRTLVLQRPTLGAIIKSFLRVHVPKEGLIRAPPNRFSFQSTFELNRITSEVVYKAAGSLCK